MLWGKAASLTGRPRNPPHLLVNAGRQIRGRPPQPPAFACKKLAGQYLAGRRGVSLGFVAGAAGTPRTFTLSQKNHTHDIHTMTIELLSCTRQVNEYANDSIGINKLLSNTGALAFIISLLMVLIIMVFYPAKSGTGFYVLIKIFIYMFGGTFLLMFIHDGLLKSAFMEYSKGADLSEIVNAVADPQSNSRMAFGVQTPQQTPKQSPQQTPQQSPKPATQQTTQPATQPVAAVLGGMGHHSLPARKPPVALANPFEKPF
jgi:hypothetical protein